MRLPLTLTGVYAETHLSERVVSDCVKYFLLKDKSEQYQLLDLFI